MSKKKIALIAVGGTGGHVFPGCNLAKHLNDSGYNVKLATDRRGYKYLENYKDLNISILPSSPFIYKNIFTIFFSLISITYSILYSLKFLILYLILFNLISRWSLKGILDFKGSCNISLLKYFSLIKL